MSKVIRNIIIIVSILIGIVAIYYCIKENKMQKIKIQETEVKEGSYETRINEILADDKEIERKWLINKDTIPYNLKDRNVEVYEIKQTYLCFNPEMRVRDYNNGQAFEFTIKNNMSKDGMIRDEVNIDITKEQYDNLIKKKEGNTINKTRYQLYADGQLIAIDIFHGDLDGLAYMEIEFPNEEESYKYKTPNWVIKDVTDDINYKNAHLARYGIPKN